MSESYINMFILGAAFLLLFASAEFLYHFYKWQAEHTRKVVHVGTGLLTMLFPPLLYDQLPVLILCSSFLIILVISIKTKMLPSINAVDRETLGSILYPITVYSCFLLYKYFDSSVYYYLPILTMALCDPVAALVGKKTRWKPYKVFGHSKTLGGSLAFALASIIITMSFLWSLPIELSLIIALPIALVSSATEAISHKGLDNITIPLAVIAVLLLFENLGIRI